MLFVGVGIRLLDGKGLIKKECLQSMFKSNDSVTIAVVAAECLKTGDTTDLG